jgi:hypothetical protein
MACPGLQWDCFKTRNALLSILINTTCQPRHISFSSSLFTIFQYLTVHYVSIPHCSLCFNTSLFTMFQYLTVHYFSIPHCSLCFNTSLFTMFQHLTVHYVSTPHCLLCFNTSVFTMFQNLTVHYVSTPHCSLRFNTSLFTMFQYLTVHYVSAPHCSLCFNTSLFTMFQYLTVHYISTPHCSLCFQHVSPEPSHSQEVQFYLSKHAHMLRSLLLDTLLLHCIYKIKRKSNLFQFSCLVRSEGLTEKHVNILGILYKTPFRYDKSTNVSEKLAASIFKVVISLSQIRKRRQRVTPKLWHLYTNTQSVTNSNTGVLFFLLYYINALVNTAHTNYMWSHALFKHMTYV